MILVKVPASKDVMLCAVSQFAKNHPDKPVAGQTQFRNIVADYLLHFGETKLEDHMLEMDVDLTIAQFAVDVVKKQYPL